MIFLVGPRITAAFGEDKGDSPGAPVIRTQGDAVLTAEPDLAEIQIGVQTEDPSAQVAAQKNAERADAVLKALREFLGRDADIRTVAYSLNPVYPVPRDGKSGAVRYTATNMLRVKTDQLKRVGEVIDRANKAGANISGGLQFRIKDDAAMRLKALEQASREARAKADAIASALGIKVKRILEVEEIEQGPRPFPRNRAFAGVAMEAAPTPIEAGTLEIQAAVALTAELTR
jgi:uncharacterized protein YggE